MLHDVYGVRLKSKHKVTNKIVHLQVTQKSPNAHTYTQNAKEIRNLTLYGRKEYERAFVRTFVYIYVCMLFMACSTKDV